jgi:hypothetical protein
MRCHWTLEDWIFKHWLAETKEFIHKKLLQKKPIYRLRAQRRKTLRTTTSKFLRSCGACTGEMRWGHRRCRHRYRRCCCCCLHHRWCRRWRSRHLLKSTIHGAGTRLPLSRCRWKCPRHLLLRKRRNHRPRNIVVAFVQVPMKENLEVFIIGQRLIVL